MIDFLRDPIWAFVEAVIGLLSLLLAVYVERDKIQIVVPRWSPRSAFLLGISATAMILLGIGVILRLLMPSPPTQSFTPASPTAEPLTRLPSSPTVALTGTTASISLATSTPMKTATPTAAPSPTRTVWFEDTFESGISRWQTFGKQWRSETEPTGNKLLCGNAIDDDTYAAAGSTTWADYTFTVDVIVRQYGNMGRGGLIIAHYVPVWPISYYYYGFDTGGASLVKAFRDANRSEDIPLSFAYQSAEVGTRHTMQIDLRHSTISVHQDGTLVAMYSDPSYVERGAIELAVSHGAEVCFDNVIVTAPID